MDQTVDTNAPSKNAPSKVPVPRARVAILISGRGSNMISLVNAAKSIDYPAEIVGIISNRASAEGLKWAAAQNITTAIHPRKNYDSAAAADAAMQDTLEKWRVDIVCLAGFMRILSPEFVMGWKGRMLNIHPSLLPKYKGLDTHQRALDAGDKVHGCTVHFVVPELDAGRTIEQAQVVVKDHDSAETLAASVLEKEHVLYPLALEKVAREYLAKSAPK